MTFGERIIAFNKGLHLSSAELPEGVRAMNPFSEDKTGIINDIATSFYRKYYADNQPRKLILGINPGRLGAGATGIPFTDTKRLKEICGINVDSFETHEPSSVFVYELIEAWGGPKKFYRDFYITSICPLGFVKKNQKGNEVNFNYYDNVELQEQVTPFIINKLREQLTFGIEKDTVFCMGTGKNYKYLKNLNKQVQIFREIIPLEHPRYVMQYKTKQKEFYIEKYLEALTLN